MIAIIGLTNALASPNIIPGTINAKAGFSILGFLIQAWDPSDIRIGQFISGPESKVIDCSRINSSIPSEVCYNLLVNTGTIFTCKN